MSALNDFSLKIIYEHGSNTFACTMTNSILKISDLSSDGRVTVTVKPKEKIKLISATLTKNFKYGKNDRIFVNGYQSWTDTKEFLPCERLRNAKKIPAVLRKAFAFEYYGDAFFKEYRENVIHGYDISYIDGENDLFICSKNARNAFLIINHDIENGRLCLESDIGALTTDSEITLFDFVISPLPKEDCFDICLGQIKSPQKLIGYTSWYNHYQNINEEKIISALDGIDSRFDLFQIDDGFEEFVGDWTEIDKNKFPRTLSPVVERIHEKGLKAGIWLAPFVAERKSRTARTHPEWLLKDDAGKAILCGSNWSGFYAFDFYNSEAREYIRKCLEMYLSLGFDFFKLDFLYAVNVKVPKSKTRAEVAFEAYSFLREVLGEKLILGCGAHITPSDSLFDYMRVGPDVSLSFDDTWYMRLMHRERISTKVTIQNTVFRSFLNGRMFGCDPDVFLLRDENIKLSEEQKTALLTMNALFGSLMMTSDDISSYDKTKNAALDRALLLSEKARVTKYERRAESIEVFYLLDGKEHHLSYDTEKGVCIETR